MAMGYVAAMVMIPPARADVWGLSNPVQGFLLCCWALRLVDVDCMCVVVVM
jgi:hypothetical protein